MIISKYYDIPNFIHDAGHKGAPYSFDGSHWLNHGELIEALYKAVLGYKPEKDANTSFCEGSDIPELNCSVKSSKATLTSVVLGENYATTKKVYFERVASSLWAWVDLKEDCLIAYTMNRDEFSDFMDEFSAYATDRKGIRFKAHSSKMEAWFSRRSRLN